MFCTSLQVARPKKKNPTFLDQGKSLYFVVQMLSRLNKFFTNNNGSSVLNMFIISAGDIVYHTASRTIERTFAHRTERTMSFFVFLDFVTYDRCFVIICVSHKPKY